MAHRIQPHKIYIVLIEAFQIFKLQPTVMRSAFIAVDIFSQNVAEYVSHRELQ